jgi:hypothetical protein
MVKQSPARQKVVFGFGAGRPTKPTLPEAVQYAINGDGGLEEADHGIGVVGPRRMVLD